MQKNTGSNDDKCTVNHITHLQLYVLRLILVATVETLNNCRADIQKRVPLFSFGVS